MIKKLVVVALVLFSSATYSEELTDEKKRVIDEMLEITGALKVAEMMGVAVSNQVIDAMAQSNGEPDPRVIEIVKDETAKIMHDEFIANRFIHEMSYTIYHKYFTTAELQEMVAFYKTPTGAKLASLLPQVSQEGMIAGQKHGESLGPIIQQRLEARFKQEGIE